MNNRNDNFYGADDSISDVLQEFEGVTLPQTTRVSSPAEAAANAEAAPAKAPLSQAKKKIIAAAAAVIVIAAAAGAGLIADCVNKNYAEIQGRLVPVSKVTEVSYDGIPSEEELLRLARCENLTTLDLTAADVQAEDIARIRSLLPDCRVVWTVDLGSVSARSDAEKVELDGAFREEWHNIRYLTDLETVRFTKVENWADVTGFMEQYGQYGYEWTVNILGTEYEWDTAALDLSGKTVSDAAALTDALTRLPSLTSADITGCGLTCEQISALRSAFGGCAFTWDYTLYSKTFTDADTELDLRDAPISSLEELKAALPYLDGVTRINLTDVAGIPSSEIEALADEYTSIKFVWRIYFGKWSVCTDAVSFSTWNEKEPDLRLTSKDVQVLKYCTELEALDLGHNSIRDISFLSSMPKLKILILADNDVRDITPIAGLTELEYAELFVNPITDLTPLYGLTKLRDLNLCWTSVKDVSGLTQITSLERLWMSNTRASDNQLYQVKKGLPDCKCNFTALGSTADGWREGERYEWMLNYFGKSVE